MGERDDDIKTPWYPGQKLGYSVRDAAKAMSVSQRTVWRWIDAGKVETTKVGKRVIIHAASLQGLLKNDD
jgi:excisionase family DNA binding protein